MFSSPAAASPPTASATLRSIRVISRQTIACAAPRGQAEAAEPPPSSSSGDSSGAADEELILVYNPEINMLRPEIGEKGLDFIEDPVLREPAIVAHALAEYDGWARYLVFLFAVYTWNSAQFEPDSTVLAVNRSVIFEALCMDTTDDPAADMAEAEQRLWRVLASRPAFLQALTAVAVWAREEPRGSSWAVPPGEATGQAMAEAGAGWALQGDGDVDKLASYLAGALVASNRPVVILAEALTVGGAATAAGWWLGQLCGVDGGAVLAQAQVVPPGGTWLAWTAPYVAATVAAGMAFPDLMFKNVLRPLAFDQRPLVRALPPAAAVAAAAAVSLCQCLIYQGMWQQALTDLLGGSRDADLLTDPYALEAEVGRAMGTLVGSPRLPASLLVPFAAVATGLLEASVFFGASALRAASLAAGPVALPFIFEQLGLASCLQLWRPPPVDRRYQLATDEYSWTAARVALSGAYLALETSLTGSLGAAAGTSAAGLLAALLLCRRSGGGSDGGSEGSRSGGGWGSASNS